MKSSNYKKYIFKISLIFLLLFSAFACVYAVENYKSSNIVGLNFQFNMQGNRNPLENAPLFQNGPKQKSNESNNVANEKGNKENRQPGQFGGNMQRDSGNNKYFSALNIYSVIFMIISCIAYYLLKCRKLNINLKDEKLLIFTLLAVGFLLRVAASTLMEGFSGDVNLFKNWAETAANGFSNFYSSARQADYPPFYIYILGLIGKLSSISYLNSYYVLLLKLPSILADVITSYFIYKLGKKYLNPVISILIGAFYIFNPAIFIDSTFWGQVDSFFTLLIVIAVYLLSEKKYVLSSAMFAIAVLMKPQGIIFLPVLFFELVRQRKIKNFIYCASSALITALIIIIPFSLNNPNPLWIINLYTKTISEYPYASVNAFNFYALIGGNYKDYTSKLLILDYHTIGMLFIIITTLIGWFVYIKGNDRKYVSAIALLQIAGVFTFSVGMHERYLFPAVALAVLAFIYLKDRRFFILAIGFSITSYINMLTILFGLKNSIFNGFLVGTSILNVLLVAYLLKVLFDNAIKGENMTRFPKYL